jgi:hypothetical protein
MPQRHGKLVSQRYGRKEPEKKMAKTRMSSNRVYMLRLFPGNLSSESIVKNRNFDPETRTLRKRTQADDAVLQDTVEKDVAGMAEKIITEDEQKRSQELVRVQSDKALRCIPIECFVFQNVFNIAPKRPNWDLKREMEKKLSKLERKTQEAIHTLIRRCYTALVDKGCSSLFLADRTTTCRTAR